MPSPSRHALLGPSTAHRSTEQKWSAYLSLIMHCWSRSWALSASAALSIDKVIHRVCFRRVGEGARPLLLTLTRTVDPQVALNGWGETESCCLCMIPAEPSHRLSPLSSMIAQDRICPQITVAPTAVIRQRHCNITSSISGAQPASRLSNEIW